MVRYVSRGLMKRMKVKVRVSRRAMVGIGSSKMVSY